MADRLIARRVLDRIFDERHHLARIEKKTIGLIALATFDPVSIGTVEHLLDIGMTPAQILGKFIQPTEWDCRGATGTTAEEAIAAAMVRREAGLRQLQADQDAVHLAGLPPLVGTQQQIVEAHPIRIEHIKRNPDSVHRKQSKASWWIVHGRKT